MQGLTNFFERHRRIFVLSGAGVSTGSGIPDYRDANGDWKHQQPMDYREFVARDSARQRYWTRSYIGWQKFILARPNAAHSALARLEESGRLALTVTQNVDGLHQLAGSRDVVELHGSLARVECMECGSSIARAEMQQRLIVQNPQLAGLSARVAPDGDARLEGFDDSGIEVPACETCGGILKPNVVFFGESVPRERVEQSLEALCAADAMLVVGSSLMVYSGFRFARKARELEIPLAAINLGKTRADEFLSLKIEADCADALQSALG